MTSITTRPWRRRFSAPGSAFARKDLRKRPSSSRPRSPTLLNTTRETSDDETVAPPPPISACRMCSKPISPCCRGPGVANAAGEAFRARRPVRGRSVGRPLAASSARVAAKDPALAELARQRAGPAKADRRTARRAQQRPPLSRRRSATKASASGVLRCASRLPAWAVNTRRSRDWRLQCVSPTTPS